MTQHEKVLDALKGAKGGYVNGRYFARTLFLTQFHTRIKELQEKGYQIQASEFTDDYGFKSYRLVEDKQLSLI